MTCRTDTIDVYDLPAELKQSKLQQVPRAQSAAGGGPAGAGQEKAVILDALTENGWNRTRTAGALGISRTTLWKKMKAFGIPRH